MKKLSIFNTSLLCTLFIFTPAVAENLASIYPSEEFKEDVHRRFSFAQIESYESRPNSFSAKEIQQYRLEYVDMKIKNELSIAGIPIEELKQRSKYEVPYQYAGRYIIDELNEIGFRRNWSYWAATGNFDLEFAKIVFADEVGRRDIRTNGFAGNENPEKFSQIGVYHIDSQEGLNRFVTLLKNYNLKTACSKVFL